MCLAAATEVKKKEKTSVSARPAPQTRARGRKAISSGKSAPISAVQPSA